MMWFELCFRNINLSGLWSAEWHLHDLATNRMLSRVGREVVKPGVFNCISNSFGFGLFLESSNVIPRS